MTTQEITEQQLDGFACVMCGAEPEDMVPVGVGAHGQLFACSSHASDS